MAYFDNNATTPLDPRVRDAMLPWFDGRHGNPSSSHRDGREARRAIEKAREQVAALLGTATGEVIFTSSGSEANNAVIYSAAGLYGTGGGGHLITSVLEHPSVREAAARVEALGAAVTELVPDTDGRITAAAVAEALRPDTRLVCLMLANNEIGTIQPVAEVAALCREHGVAVLCDVVQAVGKIPVDADALGVDFLTLGGHKFHGPLGIAALWVRAGAELAPLLVGASQESGRRASTENVPAIVGLGHAAELARLELEDRHRRLQGLRDGFEAGLAAIPGGVVHCPDSERLPNTSHVAFEGVSGHQLMLALDRQGYAVSTGSACHSGRPQPGRVLLSMGVSEEEALASLRISFGITNTDEEVRGLLDTLGAQVAALRSVPVEA